MFYKDFINSSEYRKAYVVELYDRYKNEIDDSVTDEELADVQVLTYSVFGDTLTVFLDYYCNHIKEYDMENYIVINGKKAELTKEQLKALGIEVERKNSFQRCKYEKPYYVINSISSIDKITELGYSLNNKHYDIANYCTDKDLLQQQAYRETLNRLLWRFSMENDGDKIDWDKSLTRKRVIIYNHESGEWGIDSNSLCSKVGAVYFHSEQVAQRAIEEIVKPFMKSHPDFKL